MQLFGLYRRLFFSWRTIFVNLYNSPTDRESREAATDSIPVDEEAEAIYEQLDDRIRRAREDFANMDDNVSYSGVVINKIDTD